MLPPGGTHRPTPPLVLFRAGAVFRAESRITTWLSVHSLRKRPGHTAAAAVDDRVPYPRLQLATRAAQCRAGPQCTVGAWAEVSCFVVGGGGSYREKGERGQKRKRGGGRNGTDESVAKRANGDRAAARAATVLFDPPPHQIWLYPGQQTPTGEVPWFFSV